MRSFPDDIKNDNWLEYASKFPVAFAQVREDSEVDHQIAASLPMGSQGVMIASGGCTAALLAAMDKFESLTLVDTNQSQLELTKAKLSFLSDYAPSDRLRFLGHLDHSTRSENLKNNLTEELRRIQIREDCFGPIDDVSELGLDFAGRYELLFARFQHVLSESQTTDTLFCLKNPTEQANFLITNPEFERSLENAFSQVMALPNLVRLFGKEATQNSVLPFSTHFLKRTIQVIRSLPAASNPYLAQLLSGEFKRDVRYPWLVLPRKEIQTQIKYERSAMATVLNVNSEQYDFIHMSNILDWLSLADAKALLEVASKRLRKGGWLIIRQLNSNLPIKDLCPTLAWQRETAEKLHAKDRSFFYQKLHMGRNE